MATLSGKRQDIFITLDSFKFPFFPYNSIISENILLSSLWVHWHLCQTSSCSASSSISRHCILLRDVKVCLHVRAVYYCWLMYFYVGAASHLKFKLEESWDTIALFIIFVSSVEKDYLKINWAQWWIPRKPNYTPRISRKQSKLSVKASRENISFHAGRPPPVSVARTQCPKTSS